MCREAQPTNQLVHGKIMHKCPCKCKCIYKCKSCKHTEARYIAESLQPFQPFQPWVTGPQHRRGSWISRFKGKFLRSSENLSLKLPRLNHKSICHPRGNEPRHSCSTTFACSLGPSLSHLGARLRKFRVLRIKSLGMYQRFVWKWNNDRIIVE